MQVALDGANHDAPGGRHAPGYEQRADEFERRFHGARRQEQFGHKIFIALEAPAHFTHGWNHVLLHQLHRINSGGDGLLSGGAGGFGVAIENGVV
jgi:hypothetical protein